MSARGRRRLYNWSNMTRIHPSTVRCRTDWPSGAASCGCSWGCHNHADFSKDLRLDGVASTCFLKKEGAMPLYDRLKAHIFTPSAVIILGVYEFV